MRRLVVGEAVAVGENMAAFLAFSRALHATREATSSSVAIAERAGRNTVGCVPLARIDRAPTIDAVVLRVHQLPRTLNVVVVAALEIE